MAGNFIRVTLTGKNKLIGLLNDFAKQGKNLEPALAKIGKYLIESHQERFNLQIAPNGELWEPLNPRTIAKKGNADILRDEGTLADTLAYQISGNQLTFGTNMEYGATHQFGREDDGIPARPFIGMSTGQWQDSDEIVEILKSHLLD